MSGRAQVDFGYNPPTGNRLIERVEAATFVRDLGHVLDFAAQHFSSIWVSDHFQTEDRFRMECWTELAWIAARYPGPQLGTRSAAPRLLDLHSRHRIACRPM